MSETSATKKLFKWLLLTYVATTIVFIVAQEFSGETMVNNLVWSQTPKITVTYFFGTKRCSMCKNMEVWAKEVTENLWSGSTNTSVVINFKKVLWQDEKNKGFVDHYKLLGNALVISFADKGREVASKDLTDIWDVAHNEKPYKEYVRAEFQKFSTPFVSEFLPLSNLDGGH